MRVLVGIPNFGTKNRVFLDRMIEEFRSMSHDVHVVINTEEPRDFGPDVENIVGLPTENPRSLPYAHRQLFVDRRDAYDLFIFAEDDTLIEERHIDGFVESTEKLPDDLIAGFLRFENYNNERRAVSTVNWSYRWDPDSFCVHGGDRFATFTNLHGACYMLTREQLDRCVASGGYLIEPHVGRYSMMVNGGVDPYTRCGMTKVVNLDRVDDAMLHHIPELYLGRLGEREERFDAGLAALQSGLDQTSTLDPSTRLPTFRWDLDLRMRLPGPAIDLVDGLHRTVLTIGGGGGRAEAQMVERGATVTSVPVDVALGAQLAFDGVEVTPPGLDIGLDSLGDRTFDLVAFVDSLAFVDDPVHALRRVRAMLNPNGRVVIVQRSTTHDALLDTRRSRRPQRSATWTMAEHGRWSGTARWLRHQIQEAGFGSVDLVSTGEGDVAPYLERLVPGRLGAALLPMFVANAHD